MNEFIKMGPKFGDVSKLFGQLVAREFALQTKLADAL